MRFFKAIAVAIAMAFLSCTQALSQTAYQRLASATDSIPANSTMFIAGAPETFPANALFECDYNKIPTAGKGDLPVLRVAGPMVVHAGGREGRVDAVDIATHAASRTYGFVVQPDGKRIVVVCYATAAGGSDVLIQVRGVTASVTVPVNHYVIISRTDTNQTWAVGTVTQIPELATWDGKVEHDLIKDLPRAFKIFIAR